jgi:hypothetical protein
VLNCIERNIPIPAYESFFNKKTLPRRYFIFFDILYQAGRHNKQLWKVITELNKGENQVPYGSCIFEAHVMTTVQENYYKWLFLIMSDVDEVKDEHLEHRFRMEYECGDDETGEMPEELIDYQEANSRLGMDLEIYYDDDEIDRRQLLKVTTNVADMEAIKSREREELESLIQSVKHDHQKMIEKLREKVLYIREIKKGVGRTNRMSDEEIKKLVSIEKKKLIQFRSGKGNEDGCDPPEQKRRRSMNDHKSRYSDGKVQFFQKTKEMLDKEEAEGLIASWERVYKYIINKHVTIKVNENEPVMKEPSKMLNELSKAVDLEELMNEEQNLHRAWLTI